MSDSSKIWANWTSVITSLYSSSSSESSTSISSSLLSVQSWRGYFNGFFLLKFQLTYSNKQRKNDFYIFICNRGFFMYTCTKWLFRFGRVFSVAALVQNGGHVANKMMNDHRFSRFSPKNFSKFVLCIYSTHPHFQKYFQGKKVRLLIRYLRYLRNFF